MWLEEGEKSGVYSKRAVKQYNVYVGLMVGPTVGIGKQVHRW
jgi:hypothetical protein